MKLAKQNTKATGQILSGSKDSKKGSNKIQLYILGLSFTYYPKYKNNITNNTYVDLDLDCRPPIKINFRHFTFMVVVSAICTTRKRLYYTKKISKIGERSGLTLGSQVPCPE